MTPAEKQNLDRCQNQCSVMLDLITALTTRVEELEKQLKGKITDGSRN